MYDFISADLHISQIISVHYLKTPNWRRPSQSPRFANGMILVTHGSIKYRFESETIIGKKGDVLLFPKNIVYSGTKLNEDYNAFYIIDFETLDESMGLSNLSLPLCITLSDYERVKELFTNIFDIWNKKEIGFLLKCKSLIYELFNFIIVDYSNNIIKSNLSSQYSDIIDYINTNYCEPSLNVSDICREFFISDSQIRRLFKKVSNQSPLKYIQSLRLSTAKNLLLETGFSMEKIAHLCGFSTGYYFSRLFKKSVGVSPSQYRDSHLK